MLRRTARSRGPGTTPTTTRAAAGTAHFYSRTNLLPVTVILQWDRVYWYRSFTFQTARGWENADIPDGPDHGGKANRLVKSEHAYRTTIGRP